MLIKLKPNTPGQRGTVLVSKKHLSKDDPFKKLTKPIHFSYTFDEEGINNYQWDVHPGSMFGTISFVDNLKTE